MKSAFFVVIAMVTASSALAGVTDLPVSIGQNISSDKISGMVDSGKNYNSHYRFSFVHGAEGISDGSDFASVLSAFDTWISEPTSNISYFQSSRSPSRLELGKSNGKNEVSWVSEGIYGANAWTGLLGMSIETLAVAISWYYPNNPDVFESDIYFNDVNYDWRTETDGNLTGGYNIEHIALHEIGHVYGLEDVYNPSDSDYESWMGSNNAHLTMYGYSAWYDDDITLAQEDILAMALAHPAVPEPASIILLAMGGYLVCVRKRL